MARRFPQSRLLGRRPASREPKPKIVIVCEGRVTEPSYFNELRQIFGNALVEVTTIDGCGVPLSVVERAVQEQTSLTREARRSGDSYDRAFQVWAVYDIDQHPGVQEAGRLAASNAIYVARSNPCFEVWGLAHFEVPNRPMSSAEAQGELAKHLPNYHHSHNPRLSAFDLEERRAQALRNAGRCLQNRCDEDDKFGNPSTSVCELVTQIGKWARGGSNDG